MRDCRLTGIEGSEEIDVEYAAILVEVAVLDPASLHDPRRVDQYVNATEPGDRIGDCPDCL
jgi:hypothetical protein